MRYFTPSQFGALSLVKAAADKEGLAMVEIPLRWLMHHSVLKHRRDGGNDGIVIGVSSLKQLEENLKNFEKGPLPEEVLEALEEAWKECEGVCPT